jgi:hypothetical protein
MLWLFFTAKKGIDNPGVPILLSGILSFICIYLARISLRLLRKQENGVEESSPGAIRMVSYIFLLIFLVGLLNTVRGKVATGDAPGLVLFLFGFLFFRRIAGLRERQIQNCSAGVAPAPGMPPAGREPRQG